MGCATVHTNMVAAWWFSCGSCNSEIHPAQLDNYIAVLGNYRIWYFRITILLHWVITSLGILRFSR